MVAIPDPWPPWHLVLRTPRLELRPDDDQGLAELMAEACHGIHPPEEMPFAVPWTDAPPEDMVHNGMKFHWRQRADCTPANWTINFLVRLDGRVVGTQGMTAKNFRELRVVSTGSWLGLRQQGKGIGTEMRAAVLMFAFDHLGAHTARSSAFTDNAKSNGVSRHLGYEPDGTYTDLRRGVPATNTRLVLTAERFDKHRPDWPLNVTGLSHVMPFLGLE